jgi:2-dehydro-3-deoxyphosphogluconate aldolase/(4S)-4-hydroxy-2-oxoglutarate aldolase
MTRHDIVHALSDTGAVAIIRMEDSQKLMRVIDAIREGGVTAIEITMTTPNALSVIEDAASAYADDDEVLIGVGSVLDAPTAREAISAGAQYVVSPILKAEMIEMCHRYDVPATPGAFTPTEVQHAHELGADVVKVFPASTVGPSFFSALKAPMPHLKLMPTGGVSLTNAGEWLEAGASMVGIGSALLDDDAIAEGNFDQLTENARTLRRSIDQARS